jgi:hypothetical protein
MRTSIATVNINSAHYQATPLLIFAFFQYPPQTRPRNAEHLCRLGLVVAVHFEYLLRIIIVELLDGPDLVRLDRLYLEHLDGLGQAGRGHHVAILVYARHAQRRDHQLPGNTHWRKTNQSVIILQAHK